ncbi:MAG: hypothetical protein ACTHU0_03490 [Kofleriaceae bacterium]
MAISVFRHRTVVRASHELDKLWTSERMEESNMWSLADRVVKAVSDVTVGTVIVLVHVALADRRSEVRRRSEPRRLAS